MKNSKKKDYFCVKDISKMYSITNASIYAAIKKKHVQYELDGKKLVISREIYEKYQKNKYSRKKSMFEGKPKFGSDEFSVMECSQKTGIKKFHLYYLLRNEYFPSIRRGGSYVIFQSHIDTYLKSTRS